MPDSGYTSDRQAMEVAKVELEEAVEEAATIAPRFQPPEVTKEGFGKVHGGYFEGYRAGIERAGKALEGFAAEVRALAGGVGAAGKQYDDAEGNASGTIQTNSGGQ